MTTEQLEDIIGKRPDKPEPFDDATQIYYHRIMREWERKAREHESKRAERFKQLILDYRSDLEYLGDTSVKKEINKIDKWARMTDKQTSILMLIAVAISLAIFTAAWMRLITGVIW